MVADGLAAFNELIGQIYDAGLSPALWPDVLTRLSDFFSGSTAGISLETDAGPGVFAAIRCAPEQVESFATRYYALNPMMAHLTKATLDRPFTDRMLMPREDWTRTEFFNEWALPADNNECLAMPIVRAPGQHGWLVVARTEKAGSFSQRDLDLAAMVAPHLRRSLLIGDRLRARPSGGDIFGSMAMAALCVGGDGRVQALNQRAEAILRARDGVFMARGILSAVSDAKTVLLHQMLRQAAGGVGGMLALPRAPGRPHLLAVIVASQSEGADRPRRGGALMFLIEPSPGAATDETRLEAVRNAYGLTRMEALVACALASGTGIPRAAQALQVAPSTVRTHAKHIFLKMGIGSQAQLAAVLHRLLPSGDET